MTDNTAPKESQYLTLEWVETESANNHRLANMIPALRDAFKDYYGGLAIAEGSAEESARDLALEKWLESGDESAQVAQQLHDQIAKGREALAQWEAQYTDLVEAGAPQYLDEATQELAAKSAAVGETIAHAAKTINLLITSSYGVTKQSDLPKHVPSLRQRRRGASSNAATGSWRPDLDSATINGEVVEPGDGRQWPTMGDIAAKVGITPATLGRMLLDRNGNNKTLPEGVFTNFDLEINGTEHRIGLKPRDEADKPVRGRQASAE